MIDVGQAAPDFTFADRHGETHRLSDWLREGSVIVYFYPADFTMVCTKQACMMRDRHEDLAGAGVRVIGVSPQGDESHARFQSEHRLPFPLVPDTDRRLAKAYGVEGPLGLGVRRASFLIGQDGKVQSVVRADLRVGRHESFIDDVIVQAKGGDR